MLLAISFFKSLEEVTFNALFSATLPWKEVIRHIPNVTAITYRDSCNNDILRCIAECCPQLETIDVKYSTDITDDGLKLFSCPTMENEAIGAGRGVAKGKKLPCRLLKEVLVDFTSVGDKGIEALLKNLPLLEKCDYLDLTNLLHRMHENEIGSLNEIKPYNLTYLNFTNPDCEDIYENVLKICFKLCPKLKYLNCLIYEVEHLNMCSVLTDLEDFTLYANGDSVINVDDYLKENGGKLTSLSLHGVAVSLCSLGLNCVRLRSLELWRGVIIQNDGNDSIPSLCNLKEFKFDDYCDSTDCEGVYRIMRSCPALEYLSLEFCSSFISNSKTEILRLCEQCTLKRVRFIGSCVEEEFLEKILLTCPSLEHLDIVACHAPDESEVNLDKLARIAKTTPNKPKILIE